MNEPLYFESVDVVGVRNLRPARIEFCANLNVVSGDNGQGKTSLLEALVLAATARSFRTDLAREVITTGALQAQVVARISRAGLGCEQSVRLTSARKDVAQDGKRPKNLARFGAQTPLVVFHPNDLELVKGSARLRRVLLDRISLYLDPVSADQRQRYHRAMRERQRLLVEHGTAAAGLSSFERLAAQDGSAVAAAHERAVAQLLPCLAAAFEGLADPSLRLSARYVAGGCTDAREFEARLAHSRRADLQRKKATFGPQRDDLELYLNDRTARQHASQGQQRLLTVALKLAELGCVERAQQLRPVLLLDDVSSELDPRRLRGVLEHLEQNDNQVFVTTTRADLLDVPSLKVANRLDLAVSEGTVHQL